MTAITQHHAQAAVALEARQPNALFFAGRGLAADLLSSLVFGGLMASVHNVVLATGVAMAVGVAQIGYALARRKSVDALQWLSLFLVVVFGAASLFTHDPRFIMFKPTLIYCAVGVTMLTPGWMTRYMVPDALEWSRDLVIAFGYVWAAMMFVTAGLNAFMAMKGDAKAWAEFFTIFPIASKASLFAIQFVTTRAIVKRRMRAAGAL